MAGARQHATLSRDFLFFSTAVFLAIIFLFCILWFQTYQNELKNKKAQLEVEADRINMVVSDSISYISQYAAFIGEKISQHPDTKDINYISSLIEGKYIGQPQKQNFYFTTTFDWVTPDKMLRASNKIGVLKEPYDMSDRDYLQRTPKFPWTLQMSTPRIGGISGIWILPAGMGITDKKGNFIGSITLGFALDGLEKKISEARIPADVHYLVLTDDLHPALSSEGGSITGVDSEFHLQGDLSQIKETSNKYLEKPLIYKGVEYRYVEKVLGYPYLIFTGYNENMPATLFNKIFLSRLAELFVIILAALGALILLRRRMIEPVMELARKADLIRQGHRVKSMESPISEIALLDSELQQISDLLYNEQMITKELEIARDKALHASRAKSDFLANMSHELRTPMNAVIGLTNIMLMKNSPEDQEKFLKTMQVSANHLMQLINDLLDLAKLENEDVKLETIPFSLDDLVNEVASINGVKANEKGIKLEVHGNNTACHPLGDPHRLSQVVMNLVGNAVKFTEKGGVTINYECHNNHDETNIDIKIDVIDTGIGIPKKELENIFNKFVQADTSTTRKYGGTGLGLSISKNLVEKMNGKLTVESKRGKGSCFTVTLSLPNSQMINSSTKTKSAKKEKKQYKYNVLLAEDNEANVLVATTVLDNAGYKWKHVDNGKDALKKFQQEQFDIILMDVHMPKLDGIEATKRIRELERSQNLEPVLIVGVTSHVTIEVREQCFSAGMDDFITKPFDPISLISRIAALYKEKKLRKTA